jgi:hypothetical protein
LSADVQWIDPFINAEKNNVIGTLRAQGLLHRLADPRLFAEASQLQMDIEPVARENIAKFVQEASNSPDSVLQRARSLAGL